MNSKEYYDYWNCYAQKNYTQACYNHASLYYDQVGGFPSNNVSSEVKVIPGSNYADRNYQQMAEGVVNNQQQWNQNQQNPDLYQIYHQTQMNMQQKPNINIAQSAVLLKKYKKFYQYGQYSPTPVNRVYDMPGFPSPKSDTPDKCSVTSSPELTIAMDKKFLSPVMATNQPKLEVHTPPSSCQSDDSPALRRLLTQPKINHSPPPYFVPAAMNNNSLMKRASILQTPQSDAMQLTETTADLAADLDAFLATKLDLKTDETSTSNERFNPPKKTVQNVTNMSQGVLIYPKETAGTSRQSHNLSVSIPNPPMPIVGKNEKESPALVDNDLQNADENGYFPWMKNMPNGNVKNSKQTKRTRQTYTRYQTLELEKEFFSSLYLTRKRRIEVSHGLGLSERQIKIWYQNRRMKKKKADKLASSKAEKLQSLPSGEVENGISKVSQFCGGYANNTQMNQHVFNQSQAMRVNTAPVHHQNYPTAMGTINQSMYSPTMDASVNTPPMGQPLFSPSMDAPVNNLPTEQEFYSPMGNTVSTTTMYSPTTDTSVSSSPNNSHFSPTMGPSVNLISPAINQELYSPTMDDSVNNTHMTQQMYSPITGPSGSSIPVYSPTMGPSLSTVPAYSQNMDPSSNAPLNLPRYSPIMGSSVSSAPMNQAMFSPPAGTDAPDNMNGIYGMGLNLNHMQGMSDYPIIG